MKSDFFIDRPVFSTVISVLIVIVGVIGLTMLPIDQYPDVVPPQVRISASYPGASAMAVSQAVATPIEQELNGTPGMLYMESSNTNTGSFTATVTFDSSTDPDLAAVEIQNRVKEAESRLPSEVVQNGISIEKQAPNRLLTITLQSTDPKFDEVYLSNYATLNVVDMIRRVPGVGRVQSVGGRYYAMQIWLQPDKLASLGLTVGDLQSAIRDQNRESAAGVLGQQPIENVDVTTPITATGRLSSENEFENIIVRASDDGTILRMRDVARVSLEAQSYNTESGIDGANAAVINVLMLPGANDGITYDIPFDMTDYISESIHEVYKTLFEALLLVILVVFLSLQSWRATLVPAIAVPISLIGTFGVMLIFGFSLNTMTLLGLVLAIGIVVDDAIVVVENVDRIMEQEHLNRRRTGSDVAGALRGVRARELPVRHHRPAVQAVQRHDRGVGDHLHGGRADAQPRDVRHLPASRGREEEFHFQEDNLVVRYRQHLLCPHGAHESQIFQAHVRRLRSGVRGHLRDVEDDSAELPSGGGPGLFHGGARTPRGLDPRADREGFGKGNGVLHAPA